MLARARVKCPRPYLPMFQNLFQSPRAAYARTHVLDSRLVYPIKKKLLMLAVMPSPLQEPHQHAKIHAIGHTTGYVFFFELS